MGLVRVGVRLHSPDNVVKRYLLSREYQLSICIVYQSLLLQKQISFSNSFHLVELYVDFVFKV